MVNLDAFSKAIGLSIGFTLELPWRFNGFADRVAKRNPAQQGSGCGLRTVHDGYVIRQ